MGKIADILERQGDVEEALRIRREEQLPVYDRLGDVRERAITMGKIADILQTRGEVEEALRIHDERLPLAERMQDLDSIVHILVSSSRIRVGKGIDNQETFDRIFADSSRAYVLAKQLKRLDFIVATAIDLGQLQATAGANDQACPLFAEAEQGLIELGQKQSAAQIRAMMDELGCGSDHIAT